MTDTAYSPAPVMDIRSDVSPEGLVAPGQEELAQQFLLEQEAGDELEPTGETGAQQEEQELLLGKFRSQEELLKAYQQLERKLGQGQAQDDGGIEAPEYSREESIEQYGELLTDKFEEAGINPFEMAARFEAGEDLSGYVDKLAGAGIPKPVIEQYLSNARGEAEPAAQILTEEEVQQFKGMVGGDQAFEELTSWAKENLTETELASYNQVVDSGNRQAIFWALRAMKLQSAISAKAGKPAQGREPKLIGGSSPSDGAAFESMGQVLEAMQKRNSVGQVLYETDDAYRAKVDAMVARSDFF
jgi:hypothetical protein